MVASRYRGNLNDPLPSPTEEPAGRSTAAGKRSWTWSSTGRRLLHLARRSVPSESGAAGRARRPDGRMRRILPARREPALAEAERLSLILLSGCFDRIHYGLAMASAAAALDRPVTLFATLAATRAFLAAGADGRPGWAGQPLSPELRGARISPTARRWMPATAPAAWPGFEELLQACAGLGVEIIVCEMGLRAEGLERRRRCVRTCRSSAPAWRPCSPRGPDRRPLSASRGLPPDLHTFPPMQDQLARTARLS